MSDSNVADRLKTFIEVKGLTYSQFADACGIPRPSLSQLLTGRNKKISDIMIGQIHNMFPELSIVWLLFGEGEMEAGNINSGNGDRAGRSSSVGGLFDLDEQTPSGSKNIVFSSNDRSTGQISQGNGLKTLQNDPQLSDIKIERLQKRIKELEGQVEFLRKNPRKAVQITVYYDDNTFETFYPNNRI